MQETKFRKAVFSLWAFKFVYTLDQLLEDGYDETAVLNYFRLNVNDVGFVWRLSFTGHISELSNDKKRIIILNETVNGLRNLWTFLKTVVLSYLYRISSISTRSMNRCDFFPVLTKVPTSIPIVNDSLNFQNCLPFADRTNIWKLSFLASLRNDQYKVASSTKRLIEKNLDQLFPAVFLLTWSKPPRLFAKVTLINFAGDIFKSNLLFHLLWRHCSGEISGAQHGGGYGIIKSRLFDAEIKNYEIFFFKKLKKTPNITAPKNRVELMGNPGIILVGSMPFKKVEAFRETRHLKDVENIERKRAHLRQILQNSEIPLYIREHPKAKTHSISSTAHFEPIITKPVIWARNHDLIIFEAPGTTAEIHCIKYGLDYMCVFDLADFDLTEAGIAHYRKMQLDGRLLSVQQLAHAIRKKFDA
jgi:hypothetical protein